jgi:phage tail-like protein
MFEVPRQYVVFRDGRDWLGRIAGLELQRGGALSLTLWRVPAAASAPGGVAGPTAGIFDAVLLPFTSSPNGWVAFPSEDRTRLTLVDAHCVEACWSLDLADCAPDSLAPHIGALALDSRRLAWSDDARHVLRYVTVPELRKLVEVPLPSRPVALGFDEHDRLFALCPLERQLLRFAGLGWLDSAYSVTDARFEKAIALAVAADGTLFVSVDQLADLVTVFADGTAVGTLPAPENQPGFSPGALAVDSSRGRLYVADRNQGRIWLRDLAAGVWLSPLAHFQSAVTALAVDSSGSLFVMCASGAGFETLQPAAEFIRFGTLSEGPLDAGSLCSWLRIKVEANVPEGTWVRLWTAVTSVPTAPSASRFQRAASLDTLVVDPRPASVTPSDAHRFLWFRVELGTTDPQRSPELLQITAETAGESYLEQLPAVYARTDAETGFLRRWLEALRAEFADLEATLDLLPRTLVPSTAPAALLPRLASWIAYDLPFGADEATQRGALMDAQRFYEQRGTPRGLREAVRKTLGIEIEIVESFRERQFWRLGEGMGLGFDTRLLPRLPDSMVVPGPSVMRFERVQESRGQLPLAADRWYPIEIELRTNVPRLPLLLSWQSVSETKDAVPSECLYADVDRNVNPNAGRGGCEPMVVGETVVGAHGPLAAEDFGAALFDDTGHHFVVRVNAHEVTSPQRIAQLRAVLEAEKPAHTTYDLCAVEPTFKVGFQARVGVDTYVAAAPRGGRLGEALLGVDAHLGLAAVRDDNTLRVEETLRLGSNAILR